MSDDFGFMATMLQNSQISLFVGCLVIFIISITSQVARGSFTAPTDEGDQSRGIVTDMIVNFVLFVFGWSYAYAKNLTSKQASALVIILAIFSEAMSFIIDNAFMHQRLWYFMNLGTPSFTTINSTIGHCDVNNVWQITKPSFGNLLLDCMIQIVTNVGKRSFLILLLNFLITTQFENVIRHALEEHANKQVRSRRAVSLFPGSVSILVWWVISLLCSTVTNVVRFEWAYRMINPIVRSSSIVLMTLLISLMYLVNPFVNQSFQFRISMVVGIQIYVLLMLSWGGFDISDCPQPKVNTKNKESVLQAIFQGVIFLCVLAFILQKALTQMNE